MTKKDGEALGKLIYLMIIGLVQLSKLTYRGTKRLALVGVPAAIAYRRRLKTSIETEKS